jgi:hypothetical protein
MGVGNIPTSWSVVGTGDFNGDSVNDIVVDVTSPPPHSIFSRWNSLSRTETGLMSAETVSCLNASLG